MKLKSVSPQEFQKDMTQEVVNVIDVRQPNEWHQAHIQGAKLIPLNQLAQDIGKHCPDPHQTVYVYCQHGVRSHQAGLLLLSLGYEKVIQLQGGLAEWIEAGFPCQSGAL
ncbi:MAG: rhodanese-like domain-containing protein [Gammaproteobacteria bacterium]|nr:rhodanese-like domain-containing protein [Gammaproteobacteria bacterium]